MIAVNSRVRVVLDVLGSGYAGKTGRVIGVNLECEDGLEVFVELDVTTEFGRKFWFGITELEVIGETNECVSVA